MTYYPMTVCPRIGMGYDCHYGLSNYPNGCTDCGRGTKEGRPVLVTEDKIFQQNADGTWSEAIPLPFYGLRKHCSCGRKFWREANYYRHYQREHTDGIAYERTPTGMVVLDRRFQ